MKKIASVFVLFSLCLALFTVLLVRGVLPPTHYVSSLLILATGCLFLLYGHRIVAVDLARGKLILEAVTAKKVQIQEMALAISRLVAFRAYFEGRLLGEESYRVRRLGTERLIEKVVQAAQMEEAARDEILKYENARSQGMVWEEILKMMCKDLGLPLGALEGDGATDA